MKCHERERKGWEREGGRKEERENKGKKEKNLMLGSVSEGSRQAVGQYGDQPQLLWCVRNSSFRWDGRLGVLINLASTITSVCLHKTSSRSARYPHWETNLPACPNELKGVINDLSYLFARPNDLDEEFRTQLNGVTRAASIWESLLAAT